MNALTVIEDLFSRGREIVGMVEGLSDERLDEAPHPSIAWQVWRMGRSLDYNMSPLLGREQLWLAGGWHERFGLPPNPRDFQPGFPPPTDLVRTFHAPSTGLLIEYFNATFGLVGEYLATLTDDDLDSEIDQGRYRTRVTIGIRLVSVGVSLAQSVGDVRYRLWVAPA